MKYLSATLKYLFIVLMGGAILDILLIRPILFILSINKIIGVFLSVAIISILYFVDMKDKHNKQ